MASKPRSKTTAKQQPKKRGGVTGKGFDVHPEHINRAGRPPIPKDQKELNDALDKLFAEQVTDDKGRSMEKLYVALNRLLLGKNVLGIIHLLERRYGKVPLPIIGDKDAPPVQIQVIEVVRPAEPGEEETQDNDA